ncbi:MAG TPA: DNA-directed RNA polymerase [Candidatus Thalassarchaeaceae archaeon]|jgi:DNA-directed RNA polymerase subunit E'|nr:DNA-directed RNA polymerase [Candidatus Thalassarchaeaceae archaeon]
MYYIIEKEDTIRIPPEYMHLTDSLEKTINILALNAFEGRYDPSTEDFILLTYDHQVVGRGRVIHGDGAIYQNVRYQALMFSMDQGEVVDGKIQKVNDFGAFVLIGPTEALLHKSQIFEEPVNVELGQGIARIIGSSSGRHIGESTHIRARIVSKSINHNDPRSSKIGLNCKQPGLGAYEWLQEDA